MAIKLRNWFYTITATSIKKGSRFRNDDKPPQETFENLTDSVLFKSETGDRAKEKDGILPLEEVVGHVVAATDAEAKANTAKPVDHTLVPQTSQIPTVEGETQTITLIADPDYVDDEITEVYLDPATTTRNRWIIRLKTEFIGWLQVVLNLLRSDINQNTSDIATNAADILDLQATDTLVRGSANDTTPGYLENKIVSTTIDITTLNDGANEQISLEVIRDESLPLLYVNSNNSQSGDGSILNPFMSIDRVINRIDNTGDFTNTITYPVITSATVIVQGGTYSTALNIARSGISWFFETGATLTYTGTGFLFDFVASATGTGIFVTGDGVFNTSTGRLANMSNVGAAERFEWSSTYCDRGYVADSDLIVVGDTSGIVPPSFTVKNELSGIISENVGILKVTTGKIRWNGGFMKVNGTSSPYVVKLNTVARRAELVNLKMSRGSGVTGSNTVLQLEGVSEGLLLQNCVFSINGTMADTTGFIRFVTGSYVSVVGALSGLIMYRCEFADNSGTSDITANTGNTVYCVDIAGGGNNNNSVYTNGTNVDINNLGTINTTVVVMPTF